MFPGFFGTLPGGGSFRTPLPSIPGGSGSLAIAGTTKISKGFNEIDSTEKSLVTYSSLCENKLSIFSKWIYLSDANNINSVPS
jgi:hypothetical protein